LFQLRLPFVLEERIGIDKISAEQILTIRLHANERDHAVSSDLHGRTCGTDGLPRRNLASRLGCRSYQNSFAISTNISRNQHASMSLSLAHCLRGTSERDCAKRHAGIAVTDLSRIDTEATACSASDSISFPKNESESRKSAECDS
jgi:hypothetical protein